MRAQIEAVAHGFGIAPAPARLADGTIAHAVRSPDDVNRDTYESLRAQSAATNASPAAA